MAGTSISTWTEHTTNERKLLGHAIAYIKHLMKMMIIPALKGRNITAFWTIKSAINKSRKAHIRNNELGLRNLNGSSNSKIQPGKSRELRKFTTRPLCQVIYGAEEILQDVSAGRKLLSQKPVTHWSTRDWRCSLDKCVCKCCSFAKELGRWWCVGVSVWTYNTLDNHGK